MDRKITRLAGAAALASMTAGCGTIVRGVTEQVTITTDPARAEIRTSLGHYCPVSPCIVTVDRKTEFFAYATAPGYQSATLQIKTKLVGEGGAAFAGNVIFGGVVGMGADIATGAALDHKPNPAHIVLTPIPQAAPPLPPVTPIRPRPGISRRGAPTS